MVSVEPIILKPNEHWYINYPDEYNIYFPTLYYYKVESLDVKPDTFVLGGSHNAYAQEPLYMTRCQILEYNYFPYNLNSYYFKVRNGILLWPRINLYAYTDMSDPQSVYFKKNNEYIGKLTFSVDRLELYEVVNSDNDDTNNSTPNKTNTFNPYLNVASNGEKIDMVQFINL